MGLGDSTISDGGSGTSEYKRVQSHKRIYFTRTHVLENRTCVSQATTLKSNRTEALPGTFRRFPHPLPPGQGLPRRSRTCSPPPRFPPPREL